MFWKKKPQPPQKPSREEIIKQAQANARQAAAALGEDTLARIREHMLQKENSEFERALKKIRSMDKDRIADNIRATYREED